MPVTLIVPEFLTVPVPLITTDEAGINVPFTLRKLPTEKLVLAVSVVDGKGMLRNENAIEPEPVIVAPNVFMLVPAVAVRLPETSNVP